MTATVIRTVTILGICLDIIRAQGRLWITARDLAQALRYKSESTIRQAYYRHRKHEAFEGHVIQTVVGGYVGTPCRLFDEVAVRFFVCAGIANARLGCCAGLMPVACASISNRQCPKSRRYLSRKSSCCHRLGTCRACAWYRVAPIRCSSSWSARRHIAATW